MLKKSVEQKIEEQPIEETPQKKHAHTHFVVLLHVYR